MNWCGGGAVYVFNYSAWVARYPEFAAVTEFLASVYFTEATAYHNNTPLGVVTDPNVQAALLNMLTAHIAARYVTPAGGAQPASGLVGRISNASEGSVSVGTENLYAAGTVQWFQQTKYGSDYWNMSKPYRTARYRQRYTTTGGVPPGA